MKISEMIGQQLGKNGYRNLKDAAKFLKLSREILRVTLNGTHVPKDNTLVIIADKLGLDKSELILAAHRERVPGDVKGFFLSPSRSKSWTTKRKYPLSEEQCGYLGKIMSSDEIQIVRKFRQVSEEAKTQIVSYLDYVFMAKRLR